MLISKVGTTVKILIAIIAGVFLAGGVLAQPVITNSSTVNGASFTAGAPVTPGSIVSIFGSNLASAMSHADTIPLTASLGGVSVTFNNEPAPLFFAGPQQINAQVPWDIPPGMPANVTVTAPGGSSQAQVNMALASPGVFTLNFGAGPAIVQNNADGTFAWPPNTVPGLITHPAKIGDFIIIYANGLGAVDRPVNNGDKPPAGALTNTLTQPTILLGGVAVPADHVTFSGLNPNFVALNQINVKIPDGTPTGNNVSLQIQMDGITTTNQAFIAITP